jgi:hypothetical protein
MPKITTIQSAMEKFPAGVVKTIGAVIYGSIIVVLSGSVCMVHETLSVNRNTFSLVTFQGGDNVRELGLVKRKGVNSR